MPSVRFDDTGTVRALPDPFGQAVADMFLTEGANAALLLAPVLETPQARLPKSSAGLRRLGFDPKVAQEAFSRQGGQRDRIFEAEALILAFCALLGVTHPQTDVLRPHLVRNLGDAGTELLLRRQRRVLLRAYPESFDPHRRLSGVEAAFRLLQALHTPPADGPANRKRDVA